MCKGVCIHVSSQAHRTLRRWRDSRSRPARRRRRRRRSLLRIVHARSRRHVCAHPELHRPAGKAPRGVLAPRTSLPLSGEDPGPRCRHCLYLQTRWSYLSDGMPRGWRVGRGGKYAGISFISIIDRDTIGGGAGSARLGRALRTSKRMAEGPSASTRPRSSERFYGSRNCMCCLSSVMRQRSAMSVRRVRVA